MLIEEVVHVHRRTSARDHEEMKNPPKKVAEELGLHLCSVAMGGPQRELARQVQWGRGHMECT